MARGVTSPLKSLAKVREERAALEQKERELIAAATTEIGEAMVEAGAHEVDMKLLKRIVAKTVELGAEEALKRLEAKA